MKVWAVSVHGSRAVDRLCDSRETAQSVCEDYLAVLSRPREIVEDWQNLADHTGGDLWVRYFRDSWEKGPVEQRVEAREVDTTGRWFR